MVFAEGIARATGADVSAPIHGYALYAAGLLATWGNDFAHAQALFERSVALFRSEQLISEIVMVQYELGNALTMQGQYPQAEPVLAEAMELAQATNDHYKHFQSMARLGTWAVLSGNSPQALTLLETSQTELRTYNDAQINALILIFLGMARLQTGKFALAEAAYREALILIQAMRGRLFLSFPLLGMASIAVERGEPLRAATLLGASAALHEALGIALVPALRPWHAQITAHIHARASAHAVALAWERGEQLAPERVIPYALGEA